jgi:hypothetical protein
MPRIYTHNQTGTASSGAARARNSGWKIADWTLAYLSIRGTTGQ